MGCIVNKSSSVVIPARRRRLSLGEVDAGEDGGNGNGPQPVTDEDRSLLLQLTQQQVFDFVASDDPDGTGRRISIGSQTDQHLNEVDSFCSKSLKREGESLDEKKDQFGFACRKGLKPEAPNQDSFLILKIEDRYALYGVFDGHGRRGHDVSNFVKDHLPKILFSQEEFSTNPEEAIKKTFEKTQYLIEKATAMKTIDASTSGTTCSIVLHSVEHKMLYVAHVGDSRVVLGKKLLQANGEYEWGAVDLTIDHKPDLPEERARIEKNGGVVIFDGGWNHRVFAKGKKDARGKRYPGLNMSRAMGDLKGFHDAGISASPDVNQRLISVQPNEPSPPVDSGSNSGELELLGREPSVCSYGIDPSVDRCLLLCSDGVWEFISSEDAVKIVAQFQAREAKEAAECLARTAWDHWMREMNGQVVDDITAVLVHLAS